MAGNEGGSKTPWSYGDALTGKVCLPFWQVTDCAAYIRFMGNRRELQR